MAELSRVSCEFLQGVLATVEELNSYNDVDSILDKILFETRKICRADAGSIYLVEGDDLRFAYVQNDSLFPQDRSNVAAVYANISVPISERSMVGYVALSKEPLVIDDAYAIGADRPYSFNSRFDEESGYRTRSCMSIPLGTFENRLVGVLQLINAMEANGRPRPFALEDQVAVSLLANHAAVSIERGTVHRELILRMMSMAELRDPVETGAHVQRVGAYSAEIYHQWALNGGEDRKTIRRNKDTVRLAAMLHDVGKVGVSDTILKKPARLTAEEFEEIKRHTVFGARLFGQKTSPLDAMCYDIALNHHQKWDGTGYPGFVGEPLSEETGTDGRPMRGDEIPIMARVTMLADVFDALSSRRSYKPPWGDKEILETIEQDTGIFFDPEVVRAFFDIYDVIKAIREKFQ